MRANDQTRDDSLPMPERTRRARPGVVAILAAGRPSALAFEVGAGGIELGRGTPAGALKDDDRVSRQHVRVTRDPGGFRVEDLASRNGTFVDGVRVDASTTPAAGGVFDHEVLVRVGRSLLWAVEDVEPFLDADDRAPADEGPIIGGRLRRALGEIALASRAGDTVCLVGESGAGKELAARGFHEARHGASANAPFVAVNCAAIPEGLAERLLFGARKGAYSGAVADADGYVQSADGGTLFLDEIGELDPLVQAKLLRVLESREVLPLGASRAKKVTFGVCVASHKRLRTEVAAGRFREDLYFRIGGPEVRVPPLRERLDEIPRFIDRVLRAVDPKLAASVLFVEACALRAWPGNVRELLQVVRHAAHRTSEAHVRVVEPEHLAGEAGERLAAGPARESRERKAAAAARNDDDIRRALADNDGNVRGTARALGMHRNQLRRWMEKNAPPGPKD